MKRLALLSSAALLPVLACGCCLWLFYRPPPLAGLAVRPDGVLVKDYLPEPGGMQVKGGTPFRGIGVNYFDAFSRTLVDPADTSYREGLAELGRLKIPFARFMACGFWPKDWKLYLEDKERYFQLLNGVLKAAEESHVGLIPSLFWNSSTVPDLVGEPRDQWGNRDSKTHAFMRQYIREVWMHCHTSPAIWGWEFGNEYNLAADLPNAAKHRPQVVPRLGTPTTRSARDDLTHDAAATAFKAFAEEIRKYDPFRIIISGNSVPRPSAWHQWKETSWTQDTEEQFAERLLLDNPDPVDTLCIHLYDATERRFGRDVPAAELLRVAQATAARARKPLFVGEFGAWVAGPDADEAAKARFRTLLAAIEESRAPLAALWVYDFHGQGKSWNVTPTNPRSYQFTAISEANRRLRH